MKQIRKGAAQDSHGKNLRRERGSKSSNEELSNKLLVRENLKVTATSTKRGRKRNKQNEVQRSKIMEEEEKRQLQIIKEGLGEREPSKDHPDPEKLILMTAKTGDVNREKWCCRKKIQVTN